MAKNKIIGGHEWDYMSEAIEQQDEYSIGIGAHLMEQTGCSGPDIADGIREIADDLADGGANLLVLDSGIRCYVMRRGKAIDVGTREDFAELGWQDVVKALDEADR